MFPTASLTAFLLLAVSVAANPTVVRRAPISLPFTRQLNITATAPRGKRACLAYKLRTTGPDFGPGTRAKAEQREKKWSRLRLSCTTTTTLQVAVDHAFKGTYISRFCPSDPEEAARFPCGDLLHSTQQLIYRLTTHYRKLYSSAKGPQTTYLTGKSSASKPGTGPVPEVPLESD
ncbi:hypothetical protein V8E53_015753 [Lactarius tabidus]